MLFKVVICVALMGFVKSDEVAELTKSMRASIEWIGKNTGLDLNSSIIVAVAAGSLMKQGPGVDTQVLSGYAELTVALSREHLPENPEARQFFTAEQFAVFGDIKPENVLTSEVSPDDSYTIYLASQPTADYEHCLKEFYAANTAPKSPPAECAITNPKCLNVLTTSKKTAADLRLRFTIMSKFLSKCTNIDGKYQSLYKGQAAELTSQVNKFLQIVKSAEGLDPAFRYTFIRKVILLGLVGYDATTPEVLAYIKTWVQSDGACGLKTDDIPTRVMLSAQCFAVWAHRRQVLLASRAP